MSAKQVSKLTREQLMGDRLGRIIDRLDGDDALEILVQVLRQHGLHVPAMLLA